MSAVYFISFYFHWIHSYHVQKGTQIQICNLCLENVRWSLLPIRSLALIRFSKSEEKKQNKCKQPYPNTFAIGKNVLPLDPAWYLDLDYAKKLCASLSCFKFLFSLDITQWFLFISTTSFKPTDFTQLKFQMHAVIVCVAAVANFFMTPYLWMLFLCRSIFKFYSALCWHWIYHKYIFKRNKWFGYEYYRYVCFLVKS